MWPESVLTILFIAAAAIFYVFNSTLVLEEKTVLLPGGTTITGPLLGVVLIITAAVMLLMLVSGAVIRSISASSRRRLADELAQREREIAKMKSRTYDEVSTTLEVLYKDLSGQMAMLGKLIEDWLGREPAGRTDGQGNAGRERSGALWRRSS